MPKRRANGEGNIRKRKDGRWEGRYTVGHDPETGKAIIKNVLGKTQAEVKEKLKKARNSGLFKVDVPQAFEEIAVFNNSKKCSLSSGDFRRKTCIFCAAVVNEKKLSTVQKSHRCN